MGKATAIELARRNARVLITGRDKIKVEAVARNIRYKTESDVDDCWSLCAAYVTKQNKNRFTLTREGGMLSGAHLRPP